MSVHILSVHNEWGKPERHGGNVRDAARHFQRPLDQWLDLSAAINPQAYPFRLSNEIFRTFPDRGRVIEQTASKAYGCTSALAVPGSQWAIQQLPRLKNTPCRVALPATGYREHLLQWQRCGHHCFSYRTIDQVTEEIRRGDVDVLVVINPNNPTGERVAPERLLELHKLLQANDAWLVVDEAFADMDPAISVAQSSAEQGLIVLRSFGKFFGLPGIRLGFVLAESSLLQRLGSELGPWPLNSAAQVVGEMALADAAWQQQTRRALQGDAARLARVLENSFAKQTVNNAGLFCSLTAELETSQSIHERLAQRGIWTRLVHCETHDRRASGIIRFGLPGSAESWDTLQQSLQAISS